MRSGLLTLGASLAIGPLSIIAGITVAYFKHYKNQLLIGWIMCAVGSWLMSSVHVDTPQLRTIAFSIVVTGGVGVLLSLTDFPVLAPLPLTDRNRALTFYIFVRTFATVRLVFVRLYRFISHR